MTIPAQVWYAGSTKYTSVAAYPGGSQVVAAGTLCKNTSPAVGSERVFVAIIGGTTTAEPAWTLTKGAKNTDGTVTWMECTGRSALNGDLTNTLTWTQVKNQAVALGQIIQRNNGASYQICEIAGTTSNSSEPSFSDTAGTQTADGGTVKWRSLGVVGNWTTKYGAPYARLQSINVGMAAGDTCYVSNNHAATNSAAVTISPPGTTALPCNVICVSDTSVPPTTLATTATETTTGASNLIISQSNTNYFYGIIFNCASGANAAQFEIGRPTGVTIFESCAFNLKCTDTTSSTGIEFFGSSEINVQLFNCTISFGATGQSYANNNQTTNSFTMVGGSIAATGSVPTTLFTPNANKQMFAVLRDVDISAVTGTLVANGGQWSVGKLVIENCKLGSGVTISSGTFNGSYDGYVKIHNSDSENTNYRYAFQNFLGLVVHETSIIRTGGASDGTTALSWNAATTSASTFYVPFVCEEITQWQDTTGGSKTATVEITTNATLNNNDCWLEIEYPGSSSNPQGSIVTTRMTPLGTPTVLTTSSASWGGSAQTNKYKLQATFTPQQKGPIKARVYITKPSITVYVDPMITVA